jgi:alcohol dehydrogenase class IV
MFDHVMRFNANAAPDRFAELARVTGAGKSADEFVEWLTRLKADIGIPAKLDTVGARPEHVPRLIEVAVADICHRTNPRPCTAKDFETLFRAAM